MIYIIYGASGSGKTTLINAIQKHLGKECIHVKGATRPKRSYDELEIESYTNGLDPKRFGPNKGYIYENYGNQYGIEKKQIQNALNKNIPHFIIVNDIETIKKLQYDYKEKVFCIYLYFDAAKEIIETIQKARKITDDEINSRISKIEIIKNNFLEYYELFDATIFNHYGDDNPEANLWNQTNKLMNAINNNLYDKKTMFLNVIEICEQIISQKELVPVKKRTAFMIVPFENSKNNFLTNKNIKAIQLSIKATLINKGFNAIIVSDNSNGQLIINNIFEAIKRSEIIIVDLSYERQNCYLELGYAMSLNKPIIRVAKNGTTIHFDTAGYEVTYYKNYKDLENKLSENLSKYLLSLTNN